MGKKVKWLLIGAGTIAEKRVAPALANAADSRLVGVCDVVGDNAKKIAGEYKADEVFTDIDDAMANTKADTVYVATPVFLHVPTAIKALEAGKHVLIEKPLDLNAADCQRCHRGKDTASSSQRPGLTEWPPEMSVNLWRQTDR